MPEGESRISELCRQYNEIVCPLIMQIEIYDKRFPVEILNEIRAVFGHLSKSFISDSEENKAKNIEDATSHMNRAILDCFKYLCISLDDSYKNFEKKYKHVDLSLVSDGDFLSELPKKRKYAAKKLYEAKMTELGIEHDSETRQDSLEKYDEAYHAFCEVEGFINASSIKIENISKKARVKDRLAVASFIIGIIGIVLAIFK